MASLAPPSGSQPPAFESLRNRLSPGFSPPLRRPLRLLLVVFPLSNPSQQSAVLSLTPLADLTINAIIRVCVTLSHLNLSALTGKRRPVVFGSLPRELCVHMRPLTHNLTHTHTLSPRQAGRRDSDARKC